MPISSLADRAACTSFVAFEDQMGLLGSIALSPIIVDNSALCQRAKPSACAKILA
jgi:hypothetical protein